MTFKKSPVQRIIQNFVSSSYCYNVFKGGLAHDAKHVYFIALENGALIERRVAVQEITDEVISTEFYVKFPQKMSPYFAVFNKGTRELDVNKTRKVFGLTCEELNKILPVVSLVLFNTGPLKSDMLRGMRITSSYSKNSCELTDAWIPSDFPYITETEGNNISHLSLYGFYKLIGTICGPYSLLGTALIEGGVKEDVLTRIQQMWMPESIVRDPEVRPLPPSHYGDRV